jgi:hypothetical protein
MGRVTSPNEGALNALCPHELGVLSVPSTIKPVMTIAPNDLPANVTPAADVIIKFLSLFEADGDPRGEDGQEVVGLTLSLHHRYRELDIMTGSIVLVLVVVVVPLTVTTFVILILGGEFSSYTSD